MSLLATSWQPCSKPRHNKVLAQTRDLETMCQTTTPVMALRMNPDCFYVG